MSVTQQSQSTHTVLDATAVPQESFQLNPTKPGWVTALAAFIALVPFVGKPLSDLAGHGYWKQFLLIIAIIWIFLIYPLIVPLLASWYLNSGLLKSMHQPYAESVRRAFKVKELADDVAKRGNQRLDYYQLVDIVRDADNVFQFQFTVQRNQRLILRPLLIGLNQPNPSENCQVPLDIAKSGKPIFNVNVGNVNVGTLRYGSNGQPIEFKEGLWAKLREESIDNNNFVIQLDPVDDLASRICSGLIAQVKFTVEVYKDLVGDAPVTDSVTN